MKRFRKQKLIDPKLQLKFAVGFACMAGVALLLQASLFHYTMADLAKQIPESRAQLLMATPVLLRNNLLFTLVLLLPVSICVGVAMSFKVAGPVYRFRIFLNSVIAGEKPVDCRIRSDDELRDLCDLINRATAPLRVRESDSETADEDSEREAA